MMSFVLGFDKISKFEFDFFFKILKKIRGLK